MPSPLPADESSRLGMIAAQGSTPSVAAATPASIPSISRNIDTDSGTSATDTRPQATSNDISRGGSGQPSSQPVYKMRRTGHTGPFSFSARPGTVSTANAANAPSSPLAPPLSRKSRQSMNSSRPVVSGRQQHSVDYTSPAAGQVAIEYLARFSKAQPRRPKRPEQPAVEVMASPAAREATLSLHDGKVADTVEQSSSDDSTGSDNDIDRLFETINTQTASVPTVPNPSTSKSNSPMTYPYSFESALDDQEYKSVIDEDGQVQTTRGAIIPSGYKKSAVPGLPWICPIRSCRKLTSTLLGLGRHSTNAHRAACLNDNLDGTLTILCTYANAQPGNGTYSGGSAKPPIVVTKGPTSITDSPMAEPSMVKSRGGQPDHGDPKRQSTHETLVLVQDSDDGSDAPEDTTDGDALRRKMPRRDAKQKTDQDVKQNTDQLPPGTRMLEMANPDRRYDQWPGLDDFEAVQDPKGALIPDGYVLDRSLPKRPFICPIRTCRRLYGFRRDINGHWRACHTGCRLNDNLDGTLTILWDGGKPATFEKISPSGWPSIIVSRTPRDSEPIHTPQRPHYPGNRTGAPVWITLKSHETDTARDLAHPRSRDGSSSPSPVPSTVGHDDGVDKVASDLPRMPEKYQPETSHGSHQWICPIRSCRLLYAKRADLAYHLNYSHRGAEVNDNGDGTYSVTRKHNVNHTGTPTSSLKLKVVSRNPPDPREPAMAEPRIPDNNHAPELRVAAKLSQDNPTPEAPDLTDMTFSGEFSEQNIQALWAHICDRLGRVLPIPTEVHLRYLLSQPQVRDLELDARRVGVKLERRHLISLVVQVIGEEHHKGCTACRRDDSPFPSCIRLSNADAFKVVHALGSAKHSCGNCLMRDIPHSCSIKKPTSLPPGISLSRRPLVAKSGKKAGNGTDDDLGRRKSSRLSVIKGAVEDEGEDGDVEEDAMPRQLRRRRRREEMEGENYMYDDEMEPKPKRRAVTMRHKVGTRDAIADSQSASATRSASQPSRRSERATNISRPERGAKGLQIEQDSLEAEEWERGEGRINGDAADGSAKNVAFSQSYLSANQSIQISDKISFSTTIVMSGTSHQFAADTAKTRLCTLGNGKLRVQVDGEPEFVIGSGGMFSISPGVACLVLNRGYADAMMQVTTLADH